MYAIGHFAIGYLLGKASASKLKLQLNMPLLLTASILPDIDLALRFLTHRGPTHSLITIIALMVPFLIVYKKTAVPYFVALLSHSLIGDFFTGGTQLFWPLTREWYGVLNINVASLTNTLLELALFSVSVVVMFKTGDLRKIVKEKPKIVLFVPFGAVLIPTLTVGRGLMYALPLLLVIPSLFYLTVLGYSILVGIWAYSKKDRA